jgi:hypothetical protein
MPVGFPTKVNYATGDVLSATNMNDLSGTVNLLESAQYAAGKNAVINGDFGIWQRGTSITATSGQYTYGPDRFSVFGYGVGTGTVTQQTFTPGTAPVAGYEGQFFARFKSTNTNLRVQQPIEDVRTFAGQTATVSFWMKSPTATSADVFYAQNFGSGGSTNVDIAGATITISSSWARYTHTVAIPSVSGKTIGTSSYLALRFGAALNVDIDIWGVQFEEGSTASPFQTATGTKQGELAACQRYYWRTSVATGDRMAVGFNNTTTVAEFVLNLPVTMRIAATALEQSGTATDYSIRSAAGNTACSAVPTFTIANPNYGVFQLTVASGLTIGQASLYRANSANGYLGWSAEL